MAYRRTERVMQRLAARRDAIVAAAREIAGEGGMEAVQIVPVATRAGIAAGTVYRYFPSKIDLVSALVAGELRHDLAAIRRAADAAPGPLSALAAAIVCHAARAVAHQRLAWALARFQAEWTPVGRPESALVFSSGARPDAKPDSIFAERVPVVGSPDLDLDALRLRYRAALAAEFESRIRAAVSGGHLPDQDCAQAAAASIGALLEGLVGPLAPAVSDPSQARQAVQAITLHILRGLGVVDARARGLVVQTAWPKEDAA